ncbi:glycosyltransferase [Croceitalea rosinachiae]|uniref:Glycosyltransferase n=1 Tax=Croceitalea rosinachiae TaxID=3075596 RepID=A0ABU3ABJ0_9FLAO|nr:glycosyltransferase [Croceitalea sp. F388]MDT0607278.1 glycosyltransferase [Croceitalea sp. F388]
MAKLFFSFVIPVFNRPDEVEELLNSLSLQEFDGPFEIVLVEDGSAESAKRVVESFKDKLQISYYFKENTGPGHSRNYGMERAQGNYYIILDSDCIIPPQYLAEVEKELNGNFVHCYGGPDAAHESFSDLQKAINYAMTSFFTTGGIRGGKKAVNKFQPRSFNLGMSKEAFEATNGFGNIHPGEDPDLTFRIWNEGYKTRLFPKAFVYHKRRIDWKKFYRQVNKFGSVRPILNKWHPSSKKITYWFPSVFSIGFLLSIIMIFFGYPQLTLCYAAYFVLLFFDSLIKNKSLKIAFLSLRAVCIQFMGYGIGFFKSTILLNFNSKSAEELFPELFFSKK